MRPLFSALFSFDPTTSRNIQEWRAHVLEGILRGVLVLWVLALISGINNAVETYRLEANVTPNAPAILALVLAIYIGATGLIVAATFSRKLSFTIRAWGLLAALYIVGTIGLWFSSMSGDGRVILFAFVILSAVFFDLRYSVPAFLLSLVTLILIGWLQVHGIIVVPPERQINSVDSSAWVSGTTVFLTLSMAVLISVTYLLRALGGNLERSQKLLQREQRLSQILRTVTSINQLIVRERDANMLLADACKLLVQGQGYSFAWVGLLEPDQVSLRLAAQAGDEISPSRFSLRIDEYNPNGITCAIKAIHSRTYFRVEPNGDRDVCRGCPRLEQSPQRSGVALPLLRGERRLGVLVVDHTLPSGVFDDEEIQLLLGLSNDLAYALEKVESDRRLEVYAQNQQLLREITNISLEFSDLEVMLDKVTCRLAEKLQADSHYVKLLDFDTIQTRLVAKSSTMREVFDTLVVLPESRLLSDSLLEIGEMLVIENILDTPYISIDIARQFPIRSVLGLPLIANNQKLGTVILGYVQPHEFTEEELDLAQQAAGQIALAVSRANLDLVTHAKAAELERLYAAVQDMASSLLDAPALLHKLAHHMTEAVQASSGYIVSIDENVEQMQVVAEYWGSDSSATESKSDLGRLYHTSDYGTVLGALRAGEVIVLHDDTPGMSLIEQEQFQEYGVKSMMFVPIMAHGQLLGDIELWDSRARREFTQKDIRLAIAIAGHAASIIENLNLVNAVRASETRYRTLVEQASDGIFLANAERKYVDVNQSGCAMLGYSREELLSLRMDDLVFPEDISAMPFRIDELRSGKTVVVERRLKCKDGSALPTEISARLLPNGYMQGIVRDISERKKAEKALAEREAYFRALIENSAEGVAILDAEGIVRYLAPSEIGLTGYTLEDVVGKSVFQFIHPQDRLRVEQIFTEGASVPGAVRSAEYRLKRKDGEWRYFEITGHNLLDDPHVAGIVVNYRDVTERKKAEQALQESQSRLQAVISTALNGIVTVDSEHRVTLFNPSAERIFGITADKVIGKPLEMFIPERYQKNHSDHVKKYGETGVTTRKKGLLDSLYGRRANGEEFPLEAFISASEVDGQKIFTVIFQDITERKRAEEELRRHALELETLAASSSALRTAQSVTEMIPILARHALRAVSGSFASIFLLEPESGDFVSHGWYPADAPFQTQSALESSLRHPPGEGITGRVALTGEIYVTENIHNDPTLVLLDGEMERLKNVRGGISLPLRTQDTIIGVMHIWSAETRIFSDSDIRLLIALAETASNAIHRAVLFEKTLEHAAELAKAYDNTLAGWARALELRDELTEGHTRRVTELTLKLAEALLLPEEELIQIRRGALLHDIGKMGIPDSILHKPGAFTVQERNIMQQHTQYAYDMLASIPFLQDAIDIPYCHHEHWDGNGYPRGLKGTDIPLSARIFTVVDVWDALTSDRPYRLAWSKEKTRQYILERSGKQFDPCVVEVFFSLMDAEN